MKWLPRIQEILQTLADEHPTWVADDSGPAPSPRFRLNEKFAQQVCHEFGPSYGLKRADPGRPISSENLARQMGPTLIAWAWENKHDGTVDDFPESEDITGQTFVPVQPVNHLNTPQEHEPDPGTPPPSPGTPSTPPAGVDIMPVLVALAELKGIVEQLRDRPQPSVDVDFPNYSGEVTSGPRWARVSTTVVLKPFDPTPEGQ